MNSLEMPPSGEGPISSPPPSSPAAGEQELWAFRDLILFLAFACFAFLISVFLLTFIYTYVHRAMGWRLPPMGIQNSAFLLLVVQLTFHALIFGYIYFLIRLRYQRPFWKTIQWRRVPLARALELVLGGALLAVFMELAPALLPDKPTFPLQRMFSSPEAAYATGIFAVFVAPFMEELIFRGVLFAFFERFGGIAFAVVTTAVLFTAAHLEEYSGAWNHLLLILVVGLVFSLVRGLSGSLTPSVILHTTYNFTMMLTLFLTTQHFRAIPGLSFPRPSTGVSLHVLTLGLISFLAQR